MGSVFLRVWKGFNVELHMRISVFFILGEQFVSFLYLYLPLVLLVSANLFFFISTAAKINSIERTTAAALQGESGRHSKYTNERNR